MTTRSLIAALGLALAGLLLFSAAPSIAAPLGLQEKREAPAAQEKISEADQAVIDAQLPSYPLDTCVVGGEGLDSMGGPQNVVVEGRLIRVCCKGCIRAVKKDPAKFIAKVDAAVIETQKASYPLDVCAVAGSKLAKAKAPVDVVIGTRLVRVCCGNCAKKVKADPEPFLAKVDAALIEAQLETYPLETCLVSNEPLDAMGGPQDFLYGTRLVRTCCAGCKRGFQRNPADFLAKLDEAQAAADAAREKAEKAKTGKEERKG
ncbi:MAG: hypothetical protein ACYS26_00750 [Planctomycetota bacterium]|jgi:hypothetical protein